LLNENGRRSTLRSQPFLCVKKEGIETLKIARASAIAAHLETEDEVEALLPEFAWKKVGIRAALSDFPAASMKPTVKLEYALRALVCLAKRSGDGSVTTIDEVAGEEEIPSKFLAQIMSELRRGGLVASRRGKEGGYALARRPEEISLRDVVALMQGDMLGQEMESAGRSGSAVSAAWKEQRERFEARLRDHTLGDILASGNREMYYI